MGVRFCASSPCIPPSWQLPSPRRVQRLVPVIPGGSGHQLQGRNVGVWSTWQPVWDQQAHVSCGSWWSLSPVNRIHGGFSSAPWGCEPDPSLLCPQKSPALAISAFPGRVREKWAPGQTPQGWGSQALTVSSRSSVGETGRRGPPGELPPGAGRRWRESGFSSSLCLRSFCSLGCRKLSAVLLISHKGGPVHGWLLKFVCLWGNEGWKLLLLHLVGNILKYFQLVSLLLCKVCR